MKKKGSIQADEEAALEINKQNLMKKKASKEQEELSFKEKAHIFQTTLREKKKAQIAAKMSRREKKQTTNKILKRKDNVYYLKNMEGNNSRFKNLKSLILIQEMFNKAFKRVNTFEDFRTELVKGKEKRAGTELIQEITKKQTVEDDKETAELKQCLEIVPDGRRG
ncbi:hypothetical protein Tco_1346317 [Tanacetum coccineum]